MAYSRSFVCMCALWICVDLSMVMLTSFKGVPDKQSFRRLFGLTFTQTVLDLWIVGLIRACLMTLWVAAGTGVTCRSDRARKIVSIVAKQVMLLAWMFLGSKLLVFGETEKELLNRWNQVALAWNAFACVLSYALVHFTRHWSPQSRVHSLYSGASDERKPLLASEADHQETFHSEAGINSNTERNGGREALKKLARLSAPDIFFILGGLLFLLATVANEILVPYFLGQTIDSVVLEKSNTEFRVALTRLILVCVSSAVCAWIRLWMFSMYVARLTARIRERFFDMVIHENLEFFCKYQTGDLVSRLQTATGHVGTSLSPNLDQFLRGFFMAAGVMLIMIRTSWQLSLLPVILLPALIGVSRSYGLIFKGIGQSSQEMMNEMSDFAEEKISGVVTVRSFAMEDEESARFARAVQRLYGNGKKEAYVHGTFQSLAMLVQAAPLVATILYGSRLIERGLLSGGDLVTVVLYLNQINLSIQIMNAVYSSFMWGLGCGQLVLDLMDRKSRDQPAGGSLVKDRLRGDVEFRNVTFFFSSRPHIKVLDNVSFRVKAGEMVALVGPSGSGKTTCMALLQNFYRPREGHVMLDGIPVQHFTHKCLHSNVALVGQEPVLFSCSIRDNIKYGMQGASEDDVISAAKRAHAHEFVTSFPKGYDTLCGERGLQISGGQKQRLAMARALVRHPEVLILDEATSALDSTNADQVQSTVNSLRGECTILWIVHHLNTMYRADRVLVLEKGRLVEEGTPSDLMTRQGHFASLVYQQLGITGNASGQIMAPLPLTSLPLHSSLSTGKDPSARKKEFQAAGIDYNRKVKEKESGERSKKRSGEVSYTPPDGIQLANSASPWLPEYSADTVDYEDNVV